MSLINEALKRADAEKRSAPIPAVNYPPLTPVEGRGRKGKFLAIPILLIVAVLIGGPIVWFAMSGGGAPKLPDQASADNPPAPAAQGEEPDHPDPEVDLILARTMESLRYYVPPEPQAKDEGEAAAETGAASNQLAATTQPAATKQPERLSPASFKLSAVMLGPGGTVAIINGQSVRVGSIVDKAKVVRIDQQTVVLEADGEQFTIHM